VDEELTRDHYDRLAATYDENWAYHPDFVEWMTGCIVRRLRITADDVVADVGGGTGLFARELAQHGAVVCAEPSAAMLAQVPAGARLIPVVASA
jgi:SAM-dependent methyltransferase